MNKSRGSQRTFHVEKRLWILFQIKSPSKHTSTNLMGWSTSVIILLSPILGAHYSLGSLPGCQKKKISVNYCSPKMLTIQIPCAHHSPLKSHDYLLLWDTGIEEFVLRLRTWSYFLERPESHCFWYLASFWGHCYRGNSIRYLSNL